MTGAAGFTAGGIAAGSVAAGIQSAVYGGATAGLFSAAQSAGMRRYYCQHSNQCGNGGCMENSLVVLFSFSFDSCIYLIHVKHDCV